MKVGLFGVGAVGGNVAVRLLHAGHADVSLVVRERQRARIAEQGLTLRGLDGTFTVHPTSTQVYTDLATLPPQDILIIGLKAGSVPDHAAALRAALKPDGIAVFLLNGVPWWWTYGRDAEPGPLQDVDPHGALWRTVGAERVIGAVVYSPNEVLDDGTIFNNGSNLFILGEPDRTRLGPDGAPSERLRALTDLFTQSGLPVRNDADIHLEVWRKLLTNVTANTVSALTRLSSQDRNGDPQISALMSALRTEVIEIGQALGLALTAEDAVLYPASSNTRPSMLQDAILQRPMEVDAIVRQTQTLARQRGIRTPVLDTVLALLYGLDLSNRLAREAPERA
ncbi:2-dehydropantoate 2-reductase [Robbsia sp. KACC 23696]|uniref:ketopantoate reductase family protein n=1 Tax=Robbsia sp. KACC 23696 TaxID=3149231 RepID=UPI00325B094A